jgi:hypothetical protein
MRTRNVLAALGVAALLASAGPADDTKPTPEKAMAEAMARWNTVAAGVTVTGPGGLKFDFTWDADRFPHPTFKGGSAEAYGAFARLLVKFLDEKGNFEYLAENDLFGARLRYVFPGGKDAKVDWTLGKLVSDLSRPDAHGDHDAATRKALKAYADKIAARAKKEKDK